MRVIRVGALNKVAMFTDIHFGKKNNSLQHNQDCLDFVSWFCDNVRKDSDISHIVFMGDWFENRNSINVMTLNFAYEALHKLNALGLPVYIIIGNHDLYHRENRKVFSTKVFEEFANVTLVNEPQIMAGKILLAPFMFKEEYPLLAQYDKLPYWMGHFEFRNFIVTGTDRVMEHGPEHMMFDGPTFIFSGHFHKRQARDNIVYIGNCFPMDYGDAGDDARGMCILDTKNDEVDFIDWLDCPKYRKVKLSEVLGQSEINYPSKCRVRCIIDTEIGYSEAQQLREELTKLLDLREFSLEENLYEKKDAIAGEGEEAINDFDLSSLNDAVVKMLQTGVTGTSTIDAERLIDIYQRL
jgi:DNA repair exonuclease SbcCD nuclease subunit